MKNVLFLANDQNFENDWKNIFDMCLAWCYIYVWLLIYYVSVFICSSTDIWCKIINISCIYLHYLQSYDHLNICIIIYWNILEYIGIYSALARNVKKILSAERVKMRTRTLIAVVQMKPTLWWQTCAGQVSQSVADSVPPPPFQKLRTQFFTL